MRLARSISGIGLYCILLCSASAQTKPRVVHIFVALADNEHQGIIPVSPALGNGEDPAHNLYWGAAFGVRTFFHNSAEWKEVLRVPNPYKGILERIAFHHQTQNVVLVADAYRGSEIKQALTDFFQTAAGVKVHAGEPKGCVIGGLAWCPPDDADLVVYVGHDGLMDFSLPLEFPSPAATNHYAIILACASKAYFKDLLRKTGAQPVLWTTGLMAPEAYTLKAALDGWLLEESKEQIRRRAVEAYSKYQGCSLRAALRLFSCSW